MGWLRRDKDCIALVVAWALLLQAAILSFASGAHAATLVTGQAIVLCTAKGAVIGRALPGQSHQKADCQCCAVSCRSACGGGCGGLIPLALRVPLPASVERRPSRRAWPSLSANRPTRLARNPERPLAPSDLASNLASLAQRESFWRRFRTAIGRNPSHCLTGGPLKGLLLSAEWLQPVMDDPNGYQLEREGTLWANATMSF